MRSGGPKAGGRCSAALCMSGAVVHLSAKELGVTCGAAAVEFTSTLGAAGACEHAPQALAQEAGDAPTGPCAPQKLKGVA